MIASPTDLFHAPGRRRGGQGVRSAGVGERRSALWTLVVFASSCGSCGSTPGSRLPTGWRSGSGTSPTRSPRPSGTTRTPGKSWPTTRRSWPTRSRRSATCWTRPAATPEKVGRDMLDKAKDEAAGGAAAVVAADRGGHGRRLAELAQRSATLAVELAGKIVRRRLDPRDHAQLIQEAVAEFAAEKREVRS